MSQSRSPSPISTDDTLARGITINGLPIVTDDYGMGDWGGFYGQLDRYYETYAIGGPGAFSLPAQGFEEFAAAIRRKLILEIFGDMLPSRLAAADARCRPVTRTSEDADADVR